MTAVSDPHGTGAAAPATPAVEVKPITVPQPDGALRLGAGGAEATPKEVTQAAGRRSKSPALPRLRRPDAKSLPIDNPRRSTVT
jgi:hypothetical protein